MCIRDSSEEGSGHSTTRGRNRSVSRGGLGRTRFLGVKNSGNSSSGSDGSESSLDEDRKSRGRQSSGSRHPSSGGDTSRKLGGKSSGRRSNRAGGNGSSDSEEMKEILPGSRVEACWHRASPYSRPRRTSNWVSPLVPHKLCAIRELPLFVRALIFASMSGTYALFVKDFIR